MKTVFSVCSLVASGLVGAIVSAHAQVNVNQYHNNIARSGLYIDTAFTQSAAANLVRDLNFDGTIVGAVYAQPLYIEGGPSGPMVIAVTESNNVYALDAANGTIIWQRNVGAPIPQPDLACTPPSWNSSMGITGTPVVDLASRALFLSAMVTPDGGATIKHYIISLNVDTGDINPGWPIDVEATVQFNGTIFTPATQGQRAALAILGNILYVGYGSLDDCNLYHGWLVGVPLNNPASVTTWATSALGGGIWGVGGIASDGTNLFVATGNTYSTGGIWGGGEAIIRFQPGPVFSGLPVDYWAPTDWFTQKDQFNQDIGSSGPLLVDVPGATPSQLIVAMDKGGFAYLLNRNNLGGISAPIDSFVASGSGILQAAATYRTTQRTYVAYRRDRGTMLGALGITATNPPLFNRFVWTVNQNGCGSPFVTSTDGTNNMVVWAVGTGASGDQKLHGYDGDTGAVVYAGGGTNETMAGTHSYSTTGIAARGRIYVATDNKVYSFKLPGPAVPNAPSNLVGAAVSPTRINLTWQDNSNNETKFQIWRKVAGGTFKKLVTVNANVTSYGDMGLTPATTYKYKVRAKNNAGYSPFSNIATATTQ